MSKTLTLKGVVENAAPGASRTFFDRLRRDAQKKESAAAWTTDDELEFLANLGTFAPNVTGKMLRSDLLARYSEAIARRVEWDSAAMRCTNLPELDRHLQTTYRDGWKI